jgi:hypothetical protein
VFARYNVNSVGHVGELTEHGAVVSVWLSFQTTMPDGTTRARQQA